MASITYREAGELYRLGGRCYAGHLFTKVEADPAPATVGGPSISYSHSASVDLATATTTGASIEWYAQVLGDQVALVGAWSSVVPLAGSVN